MVYWQMVENFLRGGEMTGQHGGGAGEIIQTFMEEIRHDIRNLDGKLDAIMESRRSEARETGEQSIRLASLERWRDAQESENISTRKIALGAIISSACAAVGFVLVILAKLVAEHPGVVK